MFCFKIWVVDTFVQQSHKILKNTKNYEKSCNFFVKANNVQKKINKNYSINEEIIEKIKLESARIYLSTTNLFTISKFKIWDVEMGGNGLGYPLQRGINLGLNMNF